MGAASRAPADQPSPLHRTPVTLPPLKFRRRLQLASVDKLARNLADGLADYHRNDLCGSEELRNALIIKTVALLALAYDVPPINYKPLDTEEILNKLRDALRTIHQEKRSWTESN